MGTNMGTLFELMSVFRLIVTVLLGSTFCDSFDLGINAQDFGRQ